jgi:electron transfer flavoprotein beta subunit
MRIAVLMKDVPDLVEDLELDGETLAVDDLSFVPSEWDEQALEEALLLKEEGQSGNSQVEVTAVALDTGDVDGLLYTALAKGANRAVKLAGPFDRRTPSRVRAAAFAEFLRQQPHDLILTGVQAVDDVDGQIAGLVAAAMGWPHAAAVREVHYDAATGKVRFLQEYGGGRMAHMAAALPTVLGIQAARQAPRYVPVARVRQVTKTASLEDMPVDVPEAGATAPIRLFRPEQGGRAEMWEGEAEEIAERVIELLRERKLVGN